MAGTAGNRGTDGGKPSAKDRKGHEWESLLAARACVAQIPIADAVMDYILDLVMATHADNPYIREGKPACGTGTDPHGQGTRVYGKPPECIV